MRDLPARPDLDQLRHQARDLLRAARAGDPTALRRIHAASDRLTLAAAQRVVARDHGFPSWARLKAELDARTRDLAEKARAFVEASVGDNSGRAARLLAAAPEVATHDFATAIVLGDADRVREELARDPTAAVRPDATTGWTPLHAVCSSRWHRLDPARAEGLAETARLLLDAGAEVDVIGVGGRGRHRAPLRCATATASSGEGNEPLIRVLVERGAVPTDDDLYLAAFARNARACLRPLLDRMPDVAATVRIALQAPISGGDTETCRFLLEAGVDPRRYVDDPPDPPCPVVYAAVRAGCPAELVALLLAHGADPDAPGPDGRSPYRLAVGEGRTALAALLLRAGAADDATDLDRFLAVCFGADRDAARRQVATDPDLLERLGPDRQARALAQAARAGSTAAVALMLDLGFPLEAHGGDHGATALHAAAHAGSAGTVRLLLDRGADLESRDTTWDSTPLVWATIGSSERPGHDPAADWTATVRALLEAGASTEGMTLSPDDPHPTGDEVASLLRAHGVGPPSAPA